MAGLKLTANRFLGVAKEATYGTPVTTGIRWLPMMKPDTEEEIKYQLDQGIRGVAAQTFGAYQGVENGKFSFDLDWFITDTPLLLTNILGPDTKTGTTAPYTHTFNLAAGEPASMTVHDYNTLGQQYFAGCYLETASFKLDPEGALSCSIGGSGFPPVTESTSSPSFAAEPYFLGWEAAISIGGTTNVRLVSLQFDLKRKLTLRWTANSTQSPRFIFVGPLQATAKVTFDVEDTTELAYYTANTQPSFVATLTQPTTTNTIKFQMSQAAFIAPTKVTSGKDWTQVDAALEGIYNATDAGPCLIAVGNAQSTAY
jgi:hypothetical protein